MKVVLLVGALSLCGCAASGPSFVEESERMIPVPEGLARIVFFRTEDSTLYIARNARITLDGERIGATAYGGFHYHDVSQGSHRLQADMWDVPGGCELILEAASGQTYYFQVDPRDESFLAFAAGDLVASMVTDGELFSLALGLGVSAAESYGRECGGAFKLYPVDPATANWKLLELNLSG
jgi:hypothetical protein